MRRACGAGLAGLGLGGLLGALLMGPAAWRAWTEQADAAHALAQTPAPPRASTTAAAPHPPWPAAGAAADVAAQALARLQAHGLQVLSLDLQAMVPVPAVPGLQVQTLTWQLQGRRDDWVAAWADLTQQGPVWTLLSWQLVPDPSAVASAHRVVMQGQWQQWMHSEGPHAFQLAPMPPRPDAPARQAQAPKSGDGRTAPSVPPARVSMPGTVPPPPDLLGLQHEAERGQWGAWLRPPAAAATLVHAGQDLPPAWRVLDVDPQGVWLQALSASAPPLRLVWSEPRWLQEMPHAHAP
ncbi:MAG: hypothetical protein RIQ38_792 [Pseudomonadota bacterium]